ncbi:hypothetical protein [Pseudomonas sp. S1(2024)]|uniref:hypothetical protein n=1 Tax=Pseudomonas sp. S1(2024) TaxID=3390191 RepID=UPI00397B096B
MKKFISMFLLAFSPLVLADQGFDKALENHAQSTAREFMSSMIDQRAEGYSWKVILESKIPEKISDSCGYRERISLPERNFTAMKQQVVPVVGARLAKTYEKVIGKPNAHLALVTLKSLQRNSGNYALVVLKTVPGTPKDPFFSLIYQLNGNGQMDLCDISTTDQISGGILEGLGRELGL